MFPPFFKISLFLWKSRESLWIAEKPWTSNHHACRMEALEALHSKYAKRARESTAEKVKYQVSFGVETHSTSIKDCQINNSKCRPQNTDLCFTGVDPYLPSLRPKVGTSHH